MICPALSDEASLWPAPSPLSPAEMIAPLRPPSPPQGCTLSLSHLSHVRRRPNHIELVKSVTVVPHITRDPEVGRGAHQAAGEGLEEAAKKSGRQLEVVGCDCDMTGGGRLLTCMD